MNGTKLLLDNTIIMSLLTGDSNLGNLLQDVEPYLSFISELELLGCKHFSHEDREWLEMLLEDCHVIDLNSGIKEMAWYIKWEYDLKLPDAIIAATALSLTIPLLSSNTAFEKVKELIFIFYQS